MHTWQAQEAKAKFSQLLDECQKEPQRVTRHGEVMAYVVSPAQFDSIILGKKQEKTTVGAMFRKSPLFGAGIELDLRRGRVDGSHRHIDFDNV